MLSRLYVCDVCAIASSRMAENPTTGQKQPGERMSPVPLDQMVNRPGTAPPSRCSEPM